MARETIRRYRNAAIAAAILIAIPWALTRYARFDEESVDRRRLEMMKDNRYVPRDMTLEQLRAIQIMAPSDELWTREGLIAFTEDHWQRLTLAVIAACFAVAFFLDQRSRSRDATFRSLVTNIDSV